MLNTQLALCKTRPTELFCHMCLTSQGFSSSLAKNFSIKSWVVYGKINKNIWNFSFFLTNSKFYYWEHLNSCARSDRKPVWSCILSLTEGKNRCIKKSRRWQVLWNSPEFSPLTVTFLRNLEAEIISPFLTDFSDLFFHISFQLLFESKRKVESHWLLHWLPWQLIYILCDHSIFPWFGYVRYSFCLIASTSWIEGELTHMLHHFWI